MSSSSIWPILIRLLLPITHERLFRDTLVAMASAMVSPFYAMEVPASFLLLVCIPLPSRGRQSIMRLLLRLYDRVFNVRVVGIPLIYLIMVTSCALFAAMCLETYGLRVREMQAIDFNDKMSIRGRRWRSERNFYISFMFLGCSILANKVRLMLKEMEVLKEEIRETRKK